MIKHFLCFIMSFYVWACAYIFFPHCSMHSFKMLHNKCVHFIMFVLGEQLDKCKIWWHAFGLNLLISIGYPFLGHL